MDSFQVKQLTNATDSQIKEIVDFFTDAFHGAISMKALVGGDWSLLRELELAMLRACLLEGIVYVVTVGEGADGKIVSAGYWFGNGTGLFGSKQQRALGFDAWFPKLSDDAKTWMTKTYPKELTKLDGDRFTKEEIANRWWCYHIATHPGHRGKGYATAIVNTMSEKARAEGTFIGLSTTFEENVKKVSFNGVQV